MTTSASNYYSLSDYNTIIFDGFQYTLSESVQTILKNLAIQLGTDVSPSKPIISSNSPQRFDSKYKDSKSYNTKPKKHISGNRNSTDEMWEHTPQFKATVIVKKEGTEKTMNEIRICLNKISAKNYETNRDIIIQLINNVLDIHNTQTEEESNEAKTTDIQKIAHTIFDIASTNKFFSEIYAQLYKELMEKFTMFGDILNSFLDRFTENMKNIKYVDPNTNYDEYCNYNKTNDSRKAMSVFIVNLMKKGVLPIELVLNLIIDTQKILFEYLEEVNRTNDVDEITENVFLLITTSSAELKNEELWKTIIMENVKTLSQYKAKDKPSISSRAIFKYMDIVEKLGK